jgi:hypothetical protein
MMGDEAWPYEVAVVQLMVRKLSSIGDIPAKPRIT